MHCQLLARVEKGVKYPERRGGGNLEERRTWSWRGYEVEGGGRREKDCKWDNRPLRGLIFKNNFEDIDC